MTRAQILCNHKLIARFCKDMNLPITVFHAPYFEQRIAILDPFFKCISSFDTFCTELEHFKNEQGYFEYYNSVKESAIQYLRENESFLAFCNDQNIDRAVQEMSSKKSHPHNLKLYREENDGDMFISIDMKKANFSSVNFYDSTIFDSQTWEEFIGRFTDSNHIINSKYIRQVIMGACGPKRQMQYELCIMSSLLDYLQANIPFLKYHLYSITNDEIIFRYVPELAISIPDHLRIWQDSLLQRDDNRKLPDILRCEYFILEKIQGTDGYIKTCFRNIGIGDRIKPYRIDFKCLNAEIFHQIVKHFYGEQITEDDLVFYHNGKLARYLQEVDNPWR